PKPHFYRKGKGFVERDYLSQKPDKRRIPTIPKATAAIFWRIRGWINLFAWWPMITNRPLTTQSARVEARKMVAGCFVLATRVAVASWVRSPHSAIKMTI